MERKTAVYKGLEFVPVYFEDNTLTSPDYFQISEFPTRLTAGKNLFKLRGHPTNLRVGGVLAIEVLDYNGDPIYSEVVDYIDEDKSRVIAVYIYEETSPGDCTITLIAEAQNINGEPVPTEWQSRPNIRWKRTVPVNPNISNVSEIIFDKLPQVTVKEQVAVQLDRTYTAGQFPVYTTGTVRYFLYNGQPAVELFGGSFESDMKTGTITVATPINPTPTPTYTVNTTAYTSTVKKILSPSLALLDQTYTVYSSQSIFPHTYNAFEASAFSLSYEATPTYTATQNSESFALVEIKGLEPATGDVSRIKVYTNNKGTVSTWEQVNDIELEETEILVTSTASLFPDESIGTFVTQSTIDTYWEAHTYQGKTELTAPTLTWTTASIDRAVLIDSATDITSNTTVHTFQNKSAYAGFFVSGSYKVTVDALGTRSSVSSNNDPVLGIYVSGSCVDFDSTDLFNQAFPTRLGKRIGELRVASNSKRFDDEVFSFETVREGQGNIVFVVESGVWQIADVRTTTDNDPGFTPIYTRIRSLIDTPHKADNQISFKVEYYNVDGVASKQISYVYDKNWEGGNRYVDGDYSMLTGSLYVADSLESGVAISGYKDTGFVRSLGYEGFAAGFPGFLLWSGSALSGSAGTKGGVPYSGVGLELYLNTGSYFRYSTADDELYVATRNFFLGDPNTAFISGSDSNIEISASGFHLTADGDVTASSFVAIQGGDVLFDSNNEFVDGNNIGRIVYFDQTEYTYDLNTIFGVSNAASASIFQTFILPGETNCQISFTYEVITTAAATAPVTVLYIPNISSASLGPVTGTPSAYGQFVDNTAFGNPYAFASAVAINTTQSGAINRELKIGDTFADYQGMYVQIFLEIYTASTGTPQGTLKMKNFVVRTSRNVGSSTTPPPLPIK
jgi:hypothetical protein